ncbi:MAG: hypothetical protein Fur0018_26590 [Anaerolineales bacterium]
MKTLKRVLPPVILLALVGAALVYLSRVTPAEGGPLTASGTVEAVQVLIAPESGGRVVEVLAGEGDLVQAGAPLLRLDDALLQAQKRAAETALESAQANLAVARAAHETALAAVDAAQAQYDLALYQARQAEAAARRNAWNASQPTDFAQPVWYFQKSEQVTAAQAEVEAARAALQAEEENLQQVLQDSGGEKLMAAEERLAAAREAFLLADDLLARAQSQGNATLKARAQELYDAAAAELDAAQLAYDRLLTDAALTDVLEARARLAVARERYESALDRYDQLRTGEDSPQVQAAWAALQQARAAAAQAEAAITQAEKAVAQAQAERDLLDLQIEKLTVRAPVTGVVLNRQVEPGEVLKPGGVAFTLGQIDRLTLTVYVPEDRYGEIRLGDTAIVRVDSFPNQTFSATVTRIADQAEYTPRNVQTAEGRSSTVFAVELAVSDPQGNLKPGMPADVTFGK